jgi:AmmeMemoRadiSam system protein A
MSRLPRTPTAVAGPAAVELSDKDQACLLELAHLAVAVAVRSQPAEALEAALQAKSLPDLRAGAFVTLTEDSELRGCMGRLDDGTAVWVSVLAAARLAALGDPRFPTLVDTELPRVHLEVSVLGPMEPLRDPALFRPGVDGLLVSRGGRRGLLLPEVAGMLEPRHDAMLDAVCRKAGLSTGAWRDPRTELLVFRTCRFGGPAA